MKIAIVKLSAMGDIIHAMTALQYIKQERADIHIDWIVEQGFADLLRGNPHIDHILPVNLKALKKNKKQLIAEIKRVKSYASHQYDLVIDAQGLIKSAVVSRMLGSSRGFDKRSTREGAAALLYKESYAIPYEDNVIYRNVKLLFDALGLEFERKRLFDKKPFLYYDADEKQAIEPYITHAEKNIIYIIGSSWESKVYPKEKFVKLIELLGANALIVWGDEKERSVAEYVAENSRATMMPKLSLGRLKALIASADLVIGGDSGPTHMAWAMNRASITLFGPTPSYRNTLTTKYNRVINSSSPVDPHKLNREDYSIQEIEPSTIAQIAKELLQRVFYEE